MKRAFLLLLLGLIFPLYSHSNEQSKKWEADFKKLEKEKNEKLAPLLQDLKKNAILNIMFTTQENIPQLRKLVELFNDCILIRFEFIEYASQIGNNSFQQKKLMIISAEKEALKFDSNRRDLYRLRLDDLEFPSLLDTGFAKGRMAISLYETAILNSDIHPESFGSDIQNALALISDSLKQLFRGRSIAKRNNEWKNSPNEWQLFENHINLLSAYKQGFITILEQIENQPTYLRETLEELVDLFDFKECKHQSPSHFDSAQRTVLAIIKELDVLQAILPSEKQSILDKLSSWEHLVALQNLENPIFTPENNAIDNEEWVSRYAPNTKDQPIDDRWLYHKHSPSIVSGVTFCPIDTTFAQEEYSLFAGQFYRFTMLGNASDKALTVAVYDDDEVIYKEEISLPEKGTYGWDLITAEDCLQWHPVTQLQQRFGLDLKFRFLPGTESTSKMVLSVRGAKSDYRYTISFIDNNPLFKLTFSPLPPSHLNDLRKPVQSPKADTFTHTSIIPSDIHTAAAIAKHFNNNPIAIAAFVQNEISLCDPFLHMEDNILYPPRVYRSVEQTLISREGSPWEQSILLAALLQEAGFEAECVEGEPHILSGELIEKMLFMYFPDEEYIQVKYPAVILKQDEGWIPLFPWIKNIETTEGFDPYAFLPNDYASGDQFIRNYLCSDPKIVKHIAPGRNETAGCLFIKFLEEHLAKNLLTLDDVGTKRYSVAKSYSSWSDFPRPLIIGSITSAHDASSSDDHFEVFETTIYSNQDPKKQLSTGPFRFADLHGRALSISFSRTENGQPLLLLALPGEWEKQIKLDDSDADLTVSISLVKTGKKKNTYSQVRTFHLERGAAAALCFQTGQRSPIGIELLKNEIRSAESPSERRHALLSFIAASLIENCHQSEMRLSALHRLPLISQLRLALAKFVPDSATSQITDDFISAYPQVDMQWLHNPQNRINRFQETSTGMAQLHALLAADMSSNEHQILKDVFDDPYAISAVKLLQLAHKRHQENGGSGPGFLIFTAKKFDDANSKPEAARISHYSQLPIVSLRKIRDHEPLLWGQLRQCFSPQHPDTLEDNPYLYDAYAYMTPCPIEPLCHKGGVTPHASMGALFIHPLESCAFTTEGANHFNGGCGSLLNTCHLEEMVHLLLDQ